jgi:hypothetical protein
MVELYDEFFSMLRFAKNLYDSGIEELMKERMGSCELDGDYYWELAYDSISWVFRNTNLYYNDGGEIETWVFTDPIIERFCQLCQEYESRRGISEDCDPYRKNMEQILHECFSFSSYSYGYDWRLSPQDRGRKCLLLFTGCEFYGHDEIFEGLIEIKYGFEKINKQLEQELFQETRIIPLSLVTAAQWKEAA